MKMILGILIGLVIWQFVVCILHFLRMEGSRWTCPIPYLCLLLIKFLALVWDALLDIKMIMYFIKIGKNPFKTSIKEINEWPIEQRKKLVSLAHPKYRNKLEIAFELKPKKMN